MKIGIRKRDSRVGIRESTHSQVIVIPGPGIARSACVEPGIQLLILIEGKGWIPGCAHDEAVVAPGMTGIKVLASRQTVI